VAVVKITNDSAKSRVIDSQTEQVSIGPGQSLILTKWISPLVTQKCCPLIAPAQAVRSTAFWTIECKFLSIPADGHT
jgi:hypothetical protein